MGDKRCVKEVLEMYKLEPELKDIYVEGITDKLVLDRFLEKYNIEDVKVKLVEQIDFSGIYETYTDIKRNNKKKLLALCKELTGLFNSSLNGIAIVVDKDFDEIKKVLETDTYIFYTDYNSLEMYMFNEKIIDNFYKHCLRNFPLSGEETLSKLTPVLLEKFLIRLVLDIKGPFPKEKITDLNKSISVNKVTGEIGFDPEAHLHKILNNIGKTRDKKSFLNQIEEYRREIPSERRNVIRGHDFIHLFFNFIDKMKNNIKLSEETLERVFFQYIDYSELRKEGLFSSLENKYKSLS